MNAFTRRLKVLEYIKRKGSATSKELSELFDVSQTTIKKDLQFLREQGIFSKAGRGGCFVYDGERPCMFTHTEYYVLRNLLKQHCNELSPAFSERVLNKLARLKEDSNK